MIADQADEEDKGHELAPSSGVLLRLSKALGVGVEFFVRPKSVVAITPDYRKRRVLPRKREAALIAGI